MTLKDIEFVTLPGVRLHWPEPHPPDETSGTRAAFGSESFMRTVTYQQCTPEASVVVGDDCSCSCAIEHFWEHQEQADPRLRLYRSRKVGLGADSGGES